MITCPRCAKENDEDNQFCGRCGYEFAQFTPTLPDGSEQHFCYRHPKEATNLSCGRCGRYLCYRCVVIGPAGPRCRDCARNKVPLKARAVVSDAKIGVSRLFRVSPLTIFWYVFIAGIIFGMVRSCMFVHEQPPPRREAPSNSSDEQLARGHAAKSWNRNLNL